MLTYTIEYLHIYHNTCGGNIIAYSCQLGVCIPKWKTNGEGKACRIWMQSFPGQILSKA
jgi:hypothetical protein